VRPIGDWSMSITLSNASIPSTVLVLARLQPHPVQPVRERLVDDLVHERGLARARDAGDGDELADRELDVEFPSGCAGVAPSTRNEPRSSVRRSGIAIVPLA
jgi:hypothetical protein